MIIILTLILLSTANSQSLRGKQLDKLYQWKIQQQSAQECYGVMFDAGSSGTRVYVYQWECRLIQTLSYIKVNEEAPEKKVKPGISSFSQDVTALYDYIQPLIEFANENIPFAMRQYTPIFLGATAGMRMLPQESQDQIIDYLRNIFKQSDYLFLDSNWVRILSGQEEGAYMWLSINYLLQRLGDNEQTALTIDLGGASTQIAFKPTQPIDENGMDLIIPNLNSFSIYSISYLYYGQDQANIRVHDMLKDQTQTITSPCYFKEYNELYSYDKTYTMKGTGDIDACRQIIRQYLNNDLKDCKYDNCGIGGKYQPRIESKLIYATSSIQSIAQLFNLESFTLDVFLQKSIEFCSLTWSEVMSNPEYKDNPYISSNFFLSLYSYELLIYGYRLPENSVILCPDAIDNVSMSWTLAAMFYQVAQIDCHYDSPVCSTIISEIII